MASNVNSPKVSSQTTASKSPQHQQQPQSSNFEPLDKSSSNTLKRNPKMELSKSDLLKLLSYLEGELQARDIVIATLKSERVKQLLNQGQFRLLPFNDPIAALQRDSFAAAEPRVDEAEIRAIVNHQMATLDNLVLQQRRSQIRLGRILKDAEERHRKVVQELDEEKRKHEHDTAQGDDITYGLEKERTRLKQELELEKQNKKKLEKDLKKVNDILEEERNRQKHIVLLLLAERKKIIMKYIEERKRSEDLAQILTEEKARNDSMAEGLEEESKKSLQMEAELEKQLAQFEIERQQMKAAIAKEEKRFKDMEVELQKARGECESLKKQLAEAHQVAMFQAGAATVSSPRMTLPRPGIGTPPQPPAKPMLIPPQGSPRPGGSQPPTGGTLTPKGGVWNTSDGSISPPPPGTAGTPMMSSVAKVVQPTATVTSVPVCGPTTGIARSVSPGQGLRNIAYSPTAIPDARVLAPSRDTAAWSGGSQAASTGAAPASGGDATSSQIMGLLKSIGIRTIESIFVFFLVTLLPGLPPAMEFSPFSVTPSMPLKGSLKLNNKLNNAEHLLEGQLKGPENIVLYNGELYTSIHGGEIIKIIGDDKFVPIVKFGQPCAGIWEESICGRPLGFEFDKNGIMYVADAYYGIMKYDMKTGVKTTLVSINDTIDGKAPKIPNGLTLGSDGVIYWTDSSTDMTLEDGIYTCLGDASGRLIRYDPKTKINDILIDNVHFANGIGISSKEDFILVAETVRSRILRYYLKGPKAGTSDVFIDGLPGLPDNIKSIGDEGFLVALVTARDTENILIFQLMGPYPLLRKFFARTLAAIEFPLQYLNKIFPHYYLKRASHWIGHFESFASVAPVRSTILHIDLDGNIVESFHGTDGSLSGVSDVLLYDNTLYCGSPFNSFVGRVKLPPKSESVPVKSVK